MFKTILAAAAALTLSGGITFAATPVTPVAQVSLTGLEVEGDKLYVAYKNGEVEGREHIATDAICAADSVKFKLDASPKKKFTLVWKDDKVTMKGAKHSVSFDCPMPTTSNPDSGHVATTWAMHRGHGKNEFTRFDLRRVVAVMEKNPHGEIINGLDIPRGWYGHDLPFLKKAMEVGNSPTGQLIGHIVQGAVVKYYIVSNKCLEICSGDVVIWHLHPPAKKKAPAAKKKHGHKHGQGSGHSHDELPAPDVAPVTCITSKGKSCN